MHRRTQGRAKNVRASALNDEVASLADGERFARVSGCRGGNIFEIEAAAGGSALLGPLLVILPAKFNRILWLKKGSFVVCSLQASGGRRAPRRRLAQKHK